MAQVILHYNDGGDNLEVFITPAFAIESLTTREYKEKVRNQIHKLLLSICTQKGYNTEGKRSGQKKNIPELRDEIALHAPDTSDYEPTFEWFLNKEAYICTPLNLMDLVDDYLCDEQVLQEFDDWVAKKRQHIEDALKGGHMPVGTTIEFPEELEYFTEFPMGLNPKAAEHLKHSKYSPSPTEYTGLV